MIFIRGINKFQSALSDLSNLFDNAIELFLLKLETIFHQNHRFIKRVKNLKENVNTAYQLCDFTTFVSIMNYLLLLTAKKPIYPLVNGIKLINIVTSKPLFRI